MDRVLLEKTDLVYQMNCGFKEFIKKELKKFSFVGKWVLPKGDIRYYNRVDIIYHNEDFSAGPRVH